MESVSFLAHDIRNIAAAISLDAERMSASSVKSEKEIGLRMLQRIERMVAICEDAMTSDRVEILRVQSVPEPNNVCMTDLLSDLVSGLPQPAKPICIHLDCDAKLKVGLCESQLYRLLYNLAGNAIKAMRFQDNGRLDISVTPTFEHIQIDICDTGPGLPGSVRTRFSCGFPAKPESRTNHGFGLSIAKQMACELGGSIQLVKSGPRGTHFRALLPSGSPELETEQDRNGTRLI